MAVTNYVETPIPRRLSSIEFRPDMVEGADQRGDTRGVMNQPTNPYDTPADAPLGGAQRPSRVVVIIRSVLIYSYMAFFCLFIAADTDFSSIDDLQAGAFGVWNMFVYAIPILVAITIWFYAADRRPQQFIRAWQALPYLFIFYVLLALRNGLAELPADVLQQDHVLVYVIAGLFGLIVYGPAIFISFKVAYLPPAKS